jgi:hypothetical protein
VVKIEVPDLLMGGKSEREMFVGGGGKGSGSTDLRMEEARNMVTAGAAPSGGAHGNGVAKVTRNGSLSRSGSTS